jgi:superfamily II DNA/RNA helicase
VAQIGQVAASVFRGTSYRTVSIIGGANVQHQIAHIREGRPQILVATPGRLAELVFELDKVHLGNVRTVVVDEVDGMLREPYAAEVEKLLQATMLRAHAGVGGGGSGGGHNEHPQQLQRGLHRRISIESPAARESEGESESEGEGRLKNNEGAVAREREVEVEVGDSSAASSSFSASSSLPAGESGVGNTMLCLASATSNSDVVAAFADRYTSSQSPVPWANVAVTGSSMPHSITHGLISAPKIRAMSMLKRFIHAKPSIQSALIFVNDPGRVQAVYRDLLYSGIIAAPLHGDSSKEDRKVCSSINLLLIRFAPLLINANKFLVLCMNFGRK